MFRRHLAKAFCAGAAIATLGPMQAEAGAADGLAAHRAIYDLVLKNASENSGIDDMYGRMVYEFTGSACKGFNVKFRFVTAVDMGGERRLTDQRTLTFEDLPKGRFQFETKSYSDEKLSQDVRGEAQLGKSGLEVELKEPEKRKLDLARSSFPTEQMIEVIDKARAGVHFFETRVFDGSDTGDKSLYTTTVVGDLVKPVAGKLDTDAANAGALASEAYWPVTVAYFEDKTGKDQLPSYRVSFKLYQNGITRDLVMDYGDFVLSGKLAELDLLKSDASCK
jgi:hypothetical protein